MFCSSCGIALFDDARRAGGADKRQERRIVTVLFADLAGSTALGEQLDPEDVRDLQGELFALLHAEVERFGGTTEKFVGDAVLAVFGIPQTHEDDPERAVRAALAAQVEFAAFAVRVRDRHGAEVGLRIGVNTGEVVTSREAAARGELMVSGDAVNVAARLQQSARPSEVVVGARTHAATSRIIAYGPRKEIEAKGKEEQVLVWAALSTLGEAATRTGGLTAAFIGRGEELSILGAVASRADRDGVPQLVTLFGQAGVGKSRLLAELLARLPATRVLKGRCLPYGEGITYWSLGEIAKAEAGILETDTADAALEKLRAAVAAAVGHEHNQLFEAIAWTIGMSVPDSSIATADPEVVRRSLAEAWQQYIGALGHRELTTLVVEDIHWASAALLDLVEHLAEALADTRVLLLCTARPELLDIRPTWGAGKQNSTTLTVAPFSPADSEKLVSSLLGEKRVSEDLRELILARAEGNPFFVEEMLQMLMEEGALVSQDDGWVTTSRLSDVRIPDSVHGVVSARIDLLDATARDALRRCSVVGRVFWPAAVNVADEHVAPLSRLGLVSPRANSVIAGLREFGFKHALTRDVAYNSLPRAERRDLHRQVAEWLPCVSPDREIENVELAAYHYRQAIVYGESDPALICRAHAVFLTAGESALRRGAYAAAREQFDHALRSAVPDEAQAPVLLAMGELDALEAHWERALVRLDEAAELSKGNPARRSAALGWRSRVCWVTGRWSEALEAADEAASALAGLPESEQLARALARRSQLEMLRGRPLAIEHALEAIAVAERVGDGFANVNARINLFSARANEGVGPETDEVLDVIRAAASIGAPEEESRAIVNFAWSSHGYVAVSQVENVIAAAREGRPPPPPIINHYLQLSIAAMVLVPAGRWQEADAILEGLEASELSTTSGLVWRTVVGGLAMRRGLAATAEHALGELGSLAMASGEPQRIVPMACVVFPWLLEASRLVELRQLAREVVTTLDGAWPASLSADPIVRSIAATGDLELLAVLMASLRRVGERCDIGRLAISLRAAEGVSALATGSAEAAVEHLSYATMHLDALGIAYESACLKLDLARALDLVGAADEATAMRRPATTFLSKLSCVNPF